MTTRKRDQTIGKRHFRNFIFLGVPFAAALLFAMNSGERTEDFVIALVIGMAIALTGLVRQERLFRRYC